jgi:hypothetical protein
VLLSGERRVEALVFGVFGNISMGGRQTRFSRGKTQVKWLVILLLPVALAGCVTEQNSALPMALGPSDTAPASCLTYGNAPAYGDCKAQATVSVSQETK